MQQEPVSETYYMGTPSNLMGGYDEKEKSNNVIRNNYDFSCLFN